MMNFKVKLMLVLLLAEVLATIEITMVYSALRYMVEDFGSPGAVGWVITSFLLGSAVSAAIGGRLGDIYGRKPILLIAIAGSVVGSFIAGSSTTLAGVIIGRTLQGSAGAILALCIGILREHVDSRSFPLYVGVLTAVLSISGGLGLFLGGVVVDLLTWHWIFYITASIGVIASFCCYRVVPATKRGEPRPGINFFGGLLFVPGLVSLMVALTQGKDWGWASWPTLLFLCAGVALLFSWCRSELNARVPLLDIRLLLNREILLAYLATILLALTWSQFAQVWSLLLQQPTETGAGMGLSATAAGLTLMPQTLMALAGGPLAGWLLIRYGTRFSMSLGAFVLGSAWVAAMLKHDSIIFIVILMLFKGVASAYLFALLTTGIARAAPADRTSEAVGMMTVVRQIANSIGALTVAYLLSTSTVPSPDGGSRFPDTYAYVLTMGYMAAGTLLIVVLYLFFFKPRGEERGAPEGGLSQPARGSPQA